MESGIYRRTYGIVSNESLQTKGNFKQDYIPNQLQHQRDLDELNSTSEIHREPISGLCVDGLNNILMSTSMDGSLKIWDFNKYKCLHTIDVSNQSPVSKMIFNRENELCACVCDDLSIHVFDIQTKNLVRRWKPNNQNTTSIRAPIQDILFSPDGNYRLDFYFCCKILPSIIFDLLTDNPSLFIRCPFSSI